MGQAMDKFTFFGHPKWPWAIAPGYAASILTHVWINVDQFQLTAETALITTGH